MRLLCAKSRRRACTSVVSVGTLGSLHHHWCHQWLWLCEQGLANTLNELLYGVSTTGPSVLAQLQLNYLVLQSVNLLLGNSTDILRFFPTSPVSAERLVDVQAASRLERGTTTCVHCKGAGTQDCAACSGRGIVQPQSKKRGSGPLGK